MNYDFEADEKAGKLMDAQDKLVNLKKAALLLKNKEGITYFLRSNYEWCEIDWFIDNLDVQINDLEKRIRVELDKLPRMKQTVKKYRICD